MLIFWLGDDFISNIRSNLEYFFDGAAVFVLQ